MFSLYRIEVLFSSIITHSAVLFAVIQYLLRLRGSIGIHMNCKLFTSVSDDDSSLSSTRSTWYVNSFRHNRELILPREPWNPSWQPSWEPSHPTNSPGLAFSHPRISDSFTYRNWLQLWLSLTEVGVGRFKLFFLRSEFSLHSVLIMSSSELPETLVSRRSM